MPAPEMDFDDLMATYSVTAKARCGITREEHCDLFSVSDEYSLAHYVARDLRMIHGIADTFTSAFSQVDELRR